MNVWDGSQWIEASAASQAILVVYQYTATGGQTTFSGTDNNSLTLGYTVGSALVTLNGVMLEVGSEVTASSGTSVVLASGATAGDELNVYAFSTFNLADVYTKAQTDAFAVKLTGDQSIDGAKTFTSVINVSPSAATSGAGSSSSIGAQDGFTNSNGGVLTLKGGNGNGTGNGGNINLTPGTTGTGTAGKVYVNGGDMVVNGNNIGAGKFTGVGNILFGSGALNANTNGRYNIAIGQSSLSGFNPASASNTYNIALGYSALSGATNTGINNIAIGSSTMGAASLSGQSNIAIGSSSLAGLTTGSYNNAVGQQSMSSGTVTGTENNAFGMLTLNSITGGTNNSAFGSRALNGLTSGHNNIGIGAYALYTNTVARNNTSIGNFSLRYINGTADDGVGAFNTALGFQAGTYVGATGTSTTNVTGKGSLFLGYDTRPLNDGDTNEVVISGFSGSAGTAGTVGKGSNTTTIGNAATTDTYIYGNLNVTGQIKLNNAVLSKSDTYAFLTTDNANLLVYTGTTAGKTITLPAAGTNTGREITIKNIGTVSVAIASNGGFLISDSTTTSATGLNIGTEPSNNWIKAISDGTNWIILRALF
jgi:hypothetical protein